MTLHTTLQPGVRAAAPLALTFHGVRGSFPTTGDDVAAFGGDTACIEVEVAGGAGLRRFIIDAGTGIISLGKRLIAGPPGRIDLLLTHLHHDHVMGLFFFKPLFIPGFEVHIHCGNLGGETAEAPLRRLFSPPLFPIGFEQLGASIRFHGFHGGETLDFDDGVSVATCPLAHPSGAVGYRFDAGAAAAAVITDIEHDAAEPDPAVTRFVAGCDLVVYDAMFTRDDYAACKGWGHSTIDAGLALLRAAGAGRIAAFHHHPLYDDARLAAIETDLARRAPGSFVARQGQRVEIAAATAGLRAAAQTT